MRFVQEHLHAIHRGAYGGPEPQSTFHDGEAEVKRQFDKHEPAELAEWLERWANRLSDGTVAVNLSPADAQTIIKALRSYPSAELLGEQASYRIGYVDGATGKSPQVELTEPEKALVMSPSASAFVAGGVLVAALIFGVPWLWAMLKPWLHSVTG
jgi:hypothetical protein